VRPRTNEKEREDKLLLYGKGNQTRKGKKKARTNPTGCALRRDKEYINARKQMAKGRGFHERLKSPSRLSNCQMTKGKTEII